MAMASTKESSIDRLAERAAQATPKSLGKRVRGDGSALDVLGHGAPLIEEAVCADVLPAA